MNLIDTDVENARKSIRENCYFMNKAIQTQNMRETLKYSNLMLSSLKIENLSPRSYYELYSMIFDEMNILEISFRDESLNNKNKIKDIYEKTQHASSIIPRLYLMITAGSVLIESLEVDILDVLKDLLGMMKGVQHPFKGLFLRYYYMKIMKKRIEDQEENIDVNEILDLYLQNFSEMNKLWIRINSLIKDVTKRKEERLQLNNIVGENIHRIANLEKIDLQLYKTTILPKLVEITISHKDRISQEYLMVCIISAFQDDYHIETLDQFLESTEKLSPKVNLNVIYMELMDRLTNYAKNNKDNEIKNNFKIYESFKRTITNIFLKKEKYKLKNLLELVSVFINFIVYFYDGKIEFINEVLEITSELCKSYELTDFEENEVLKQLVNILTFPLEKLSLNILNLDNFPILMQYLPLKDRKLVGVKICDSIINSYIYLVNEEIVDKLIKFIEPIFDSNEEEELVLIGKLINLCENHKPKIMLNMIKKFELKFKTKNLNYLNIIFKFITFKYFYVINKSNEIIEFYNINSDKADFNEMFKNKFSKNQKAIYLSEEEKNNVNINIEEDCNIDLNEIFEFIRSLTCELENEKPIEAFKIWLELIISVDKYKEQETKEELINEIVTHIFEIFEFDISKKADKIYYFNIMTGYIYELNNISVDTYDKIVNLLRNLIGLVNKREDQTKLLIKISHLYAHSKYFNQSKLEETLLRMLKTANFANKYNKNHTYLFIQILELVIYFILKKTTNMSNNEVNTIINIIKDNLEQIEKENIKKEFKNYFDRVIKYLDECKENNKDLFIE